MGPMTQASHTLENPFDTPKDTATSPAGKVGGAYDDALDLGTDLKQRPVAGGGPDRIRVQHMKQRMTVFERIKVLTD